MPVNSFQPERMQGTGPQEDSTPENITQENSRHQAWSHQSLWITLLIQSFIVNGAVPSCISISNTSVFATAISRLVVAIVCVGLLLLVRRTRIRLIDIYQNKLLHLGTGGLFFLHWYFYTLAPKGIGSIPGSPAGAALGFSTFCAWLILLDSLASRSLPSTRDLIAVGLCVLGAATTVFGAASLTSVASSLVFGTLGALPFAIMIRLHGRHGHVDIFERMLGQFGVALICFVITLPLFGTWQLSLNIHEAWLLVGFMGVWGTFVNHSIVACAPQYIKNKTVQGTISVLFVPSAIIAASLVASEPITINMILGAGLILAGMVLSLLR